MEAIQAQLANFQQQLEQLQQQLLAALARAERAENERTQALNLAAAAQQAAASAQQAATAATADPLANRPLVDIKPSDNPQHSSQETCYLIGQNGNIRCLCLLVLILSSKASEL